MSSGSGKGERGAARSAGSLNLITAGLTASLLFFTLMNN